MMHCLILQHQLLRSLLDQAMLLAEAAPGQPPGVRLTALQLQ